MVTERLLTAKEAAKLLAMSPGSLYRLSRAGRIPSYMAGPGLSGVRFSLTELLAALRRPVETERTNDR